MEKKDKFAPDNCIEIDHWHIPSDLKIDESHFYDNTIHNFNESST